MEHSIRLTVLIDNIIKSCNYCVIRIVVSAAPSLFLIYIYGHIYNKHMAMHLNLLLIR